VSTNSENSDRPSRRTFAKSVAAALVTAPFAFAEVRGQGSASPQDRCKEAKYLDACPKLGDVQVPHEPPIGISGGSFTMECENQMYRQGSINHGPRKHLYKFRDYYYGTMVRLEVITEYEKLFTYECYPLGKVPTPRLKIWLQRFHQNRWVADDIDVGKTDAHILITYSSFSRFNLSFDTPVVETDKRFGLIKKGFKLEPTFKHPHVGYLGDPHFRIGRWQLLAEDGSCIYQDVVGRKPLKEHPDREVEVLGFQLIPRFNHLERLLQCLARR
jgi:hypothetical protein